MSLKALPQTLIDNNITLATGVPDGWIVPLISLFEEDPRLSYIAATREEECFGIASGMAMSGRRALVLIQNSGFLNSIGCYATLCQRYATPFTVVMAHRGGINDSNSYDPNKYRAFEAVAAGMNLFVHNTNWDSLALDIPRAMARSEGAGEPSFLTLTEKPGA